MIFHNICQTNFQLHTFWCAVISLSPGHVHLIVPRGEGIFDHPVKVLPGPTSGEYKGRILVVPPVEIPHWLVKRPQKMISCC